MTMELADLVAINELLGICQSYIQRNSGLLEKWKAHNPNVNKQTLDKTYMALKAWTKRRQALVRLIEELKLDQRISEMFAYLETPNLVEKRHDE